ncbi:hypothetical protein [Aeribacillus composti]|uniref:hypothetical protein n=1 Tax=Aeribacillus composti TaxID=1868734 RepID=UPI003D2028CB
MKFKNKETGLVWEVVHPDHIKRCKNDPTYELIEEEKESVKKNVSRTNVRKKSAK